jgi:glutamate 5-kinase
MTRLVIKLGSSSIASGDGLSLNVIADLVSQIAVAQRQGHEVALVTSGAARLGRRLLAFEGPTARAAPELLRLVDSVRQSVRLASSPRHGNDRVIRELATTLERYSADPAVSGSLGVALAASVGQPALMALYRQLAAAVGVEVCQILLSKSDLDSAHAMRDVGAVLGAALSRGLLPIINGNDTTDPKSELDNDQVAVAVAVAAGAGRLTLLTNVEAVYADLARTERIARLTPEQARQLRVSASAEGRGGMRSKLNSAARAAYCGIECVIGSAGEPSVVARSLNPRARMGTVIRASARELAPAEQWVGGIAYSMGSIGINREAEESLREGSTLFLSGVKRVDGDFDAGAVVELVDVRHPERLIGRGSVAMPSGVLRLLRALAPAEVAEVISALFRIRNGSAALLGAAAGSGGRNGSGPAPGLLAGGRTAAAKAASALSGISEQTARGLADALLLAQPRACSAFLAAGGADDTGGRAAAPAIKALRDLHAIHRDSLVIY